MGLFLTLIRLIVFGAVSFLALITLGLAADIKSQSYIFALPSAGLAIATAVFTLISLPILLFLGFKRDGAIPSYIIVELGWCFFLMVLWLAVGAQSAAEAGLYSLGGSISTDFGGFGGSIPSYSYSACGRSCAEAKAVEAFGFLNWLMLLGYVGLLAFHAVKAHQAGHKRVWFASAKQLENGEIPPSNVPAVAMHEKPPHAPTMSPSMA